MAEPPHDLGVANSRRSRPIAGIYKHNLAELIGQLARGGRDDPSIAKRLGITASQVRRIRAQFKIPAGERRWLPPRNASPGPGQDDNPRPSTVE